MVSARAEGRGMCQDKKVQLYLKCCCLKKKKNQITYTIFIVSAFIKLLSQPFLSECKHRPIGYRADMAADLGVLLPTVCL